VHQQLHLEQEALLVALPHAHAQLLELSPRLVCGPVQALFFVGDLLARHVAPGYVDVALLEQRDAPDRDPGRGRDADQHLSRLLHQLGSPKRSAIS
jgi:hypothetical protein